MAETPGRRTGQKFMLWTVGSTHWPISVYIIAQEVTRCLSHIKKKVPLTHQSETRQFLLLEIALKHPPTVDIARHSVWTTELRSSVVWTHGLCSTVFVASRGE